MLPAIMLDTPAAAFHHLALPLDLTPRRVKLKMDGRHSYGRNAPDTLIAIAAGAGGQSSWDASFDAACFYFSDAGLAAATDDRGDVPHIMLGVSAEFRAPNIVRLLHALRHDAEVGQPHGKLIGDAIFIAIAGMLVDDRRRAALRISSTGTDWRVGRALAYIMRTWQNRSRSIGLRMPRRQAHFI